MNLNLTQILKILSICLMSKTHLSQRNSAQRRRKKSEKKRKRENQNCNKSLEEWRN